MYQRFELADLFWRHCDTNSIVLALVGSAICNFICSRKITSDHQTRIKKYELLYETRAIEILKDVLEKVTKELDEDTSHRSIESEPSWKI